MVQDSRGDNKVDDSRGDNKVDDSRGDNKVNDSREDNMVYDISQYSKRTMCWMKAASCLTSRRQHGG